MKPEFLREILEKNTHISNLVKLRPVVAGLFRADEWIDMTNPTIAFGDFANVSEMLINCL
jgi:hypothetical protein